MAAGLPTSITTEIEFTVGTWTDVSALVAGELEQGGTAGRPDEYTDAAPRTWSFYLRNDDGRFTPDSPVSIYYPNVSENKRLRVTITRGGTPYRWFTGYVSAWEPDLSSGDSTQSIVRVQASDLMAVLARKNGRTHYVEQAGYVARFTGGYCDTWTFGGANASTVFANEGQLGTGIAALGTAKIVASVQGGTWGVGTPDKLLLDGQIDFTPLARTNAGPVLRVIPQGTFQQVEFFVSIPQAFTLAVGVNRTLADFVTETGELFSVRLVQDASASIGMCVAVFNAAGASLGMLLDSEQMNDGVWRKLTFLGDGLGNTYSNVDDNPLLTSYGVDISKATRVYFGGYLGAPSKEGKQSSSPTFSLAGVDIQGPPGTGVFGYYANGQISLANDYDRYRRLVGYSFPLVEQRHYSGLSCTLGSPTLTSTDPVFSSDDIGKGLTGSFFDSSATIIAVASPRSVTISSNATATSSLVGVNIGPVIVGTDARTVAEVTPAGEPMSEAFHKLARTIGGAFWLDQYGRPTLIRADGMRPSTPLASLDIEADVVGDSIQARRAADAVPTRVTISGPIGDVKVVNSSAEQVTLTGSSGVSREITISAGCQDEIDATALAGYYLSRSKMLRISQITVDLVTATQDLYALFLSGGLRPGARLRLTGLGSTLFGASSLDAFVQGWHEAWTFGENAGARFTFDLAPADPIEGIFDDAEFGRFAADGTIALAFDLTSGATTLGVIPTTTGAAVLSTSAGDYPLDLSILGERVTVSGVPSTAARTNLVTNPSFETGIAGWSATPAGYSASTTNAQSSVRAYVGSVSQAVTWPTAIAGGSAVQWAAGGLSIGTKYAFSAYVYVPAGSPRVRIADLFSTMTGFTATRLDTTGTSDGWVRLGFTATATAATHFFGLITQDASVAGQVVFLDAVLLEAVTGTQGVGAYFDGANGGAWTGTAHASTSTVTTQNVTVARGVAPTSARAHTAGEAVEVWHAAALAY